MDRRTPQAGEAVEAETLIKTLDRDVGRRRREEDGALEDEAIYYYVTPDSGKRIAACIALISR